MSPRPIELLAPAKDLATATEAILHGADAIYVGAPRFGARASAGVPLSDIAQIVRQAHLYGVRVYVTLNTILYDHELEEARGLIYALYEAGVDAVIVQDMGLTMMDLPPIALHASTQCDTCTVEDAMLLEALGFEQIVLARELNTEQIRRITAAVRTPIEVFVHGALCVSYSGRCYLSHALTGRSANRGECSQQCRLPYRLEDAEGRIVREDEHLLSLRDLNRSTYLLELLEAGVSSLKIEGRLKSMSYVKNVTAYYRAELDKILEQYPDKYSRPSYGRSVVSFVPNLEQSFNRGFTVYNLGEYRPISATESLINPHTPASLGEYVGMVERSEGRAWQIKGERELHNADGLLYITPKGEVGGGNINKVVSGGKLELARPVTVPRGSKVYRNYNHILEKQLERPTASREIALSLSLSSTDRGVRLSGKSREWVALQAEVEHEMELAVATNFDLGRLQREMAKLGGTCFWAEECVVDFEGKEWFVPLSILSMLRRELIGKLMEEILPSLCSPLRSSRTPLMPSLDRSVLPQRSKFVADYRANIANHLAREHYRQLGYEDIRMAYELDQAPDAALMCTRHCIRHEIGYCTRLQRQPLPYTEPLYLIHEGNSLRLEFDCKECQMKIYR